MGQEFVRGSAGCFWLKVSHAAAVKISSEGLTRAGGSPSKFSHVAVSQRPQFPVKDGFFQRVPGRLSSLSMKDIREQLSRKPQSFFDLASEVMCHHFCCILSVTRTNPDTKWEGITQGREYWGGDHWGHLGGWLPKLRNLLEVPQSWRSRSGTVLLELVLCDQV